MATAVSINDERHASSLIVALELYPQMVIKMIHEFPPNKVLRMIQCDPNEKFMTSLNYSEKKLIQTLSTDGFNKLDMSLLYKLIRCFNLIPEPSKKWGNRPLATDINHGDDMERMRFNSNNLVHRSRGGLSEEERDKFFKESIEIACRVDNFIGESTSSFETRIRNAKIHGIKHEKYRQVLEKCVELQQQLKDISRINSVDLYYGDDIAVKLGHQDLPATDSTRCTIYIRDPNMGVPTIIKQLEQVKKELNEESYHLKLLDAKNSYPSGTPEKKKLVDYKIDPDQLKLIKEDEGNKILWNEAKEFTKEGVQGMAFVGRQKVCSVVPRNHFGPIPGIEVGTLWKFRKQVSKAGVHRSDIAGIHGKEVDGAYSIVLSGEYEDDKDDGDQFTYTGSGGRDLKGTWHKKTPQSRDQTLTRMNKALARNVNVPINANNGACAEDWKGGKPVRVVRNYKGREHSKYAPEEGNRYDGIYKIVKYWSEKGKSGFLVWRFLFRRDDPNPAPWSKAGKKKIEELGLTMQYTEGYLEAQAKKEEAGEVTKKGKRKRDDNDSSPSGTPEKKKKLVGYKIDPDQLKLTKEDEGNKILWNEAKEFTKEGAQVDGSVIKEEEQEREEKERIDMERKINEERIYKEIEKLEENAAVKQKDRDIEIEERERMRVGISSSGGGDKSMGKEDSNMLYRLLRPDERCEVGLRAKNPNSTVSVFDHVISGTWGQQSKYISTCGSWEALNSFRSKSTDSGRIAKIQKDKLPSSVEIIDLRRQENRNHYIDHDRDAGSINKFNNFANKFQKVLLVGHVPEACVELCDD